LVTSGVVIAMTALPFIANKWSPTINHTGK